MKNRFTYRLLRFTLFVLLALPVLPLHAQHAEAEAVLEPDHILIGEHAKLKLVLRFKQGSGKMSYTFPTLTDTIGHWISIIDPGKFDTAIVDSANLTTEITRTYTISAYDSGTFEVPRYPIAFNGDTIYSSIASLMVSTVDVDTTKPIQDIKKPFDVPDAPFDVMKYVYWTLGALGVATLIFLIVHITRRKRKGLPLFNFRNVPLHEAYINKLLDLRRRQVWQRGQHKAYYTELTDILRQYMEKRWSIPAMEYTSEEIFAILRNRIDMEDETRHKLRRVLQLADMVKFAKEVPEGPENELSLDLGIAFLKETAIPIAPPPPQPGMPTAQQPNPQDKKSSGKVETDEDDEEA